MAPVVKNRYTAVGVTTANPTVAVTTSVAAGDVLLLFTFAASGATVPTAVSGCGATWAKVPNTLTTVTTTSLSEVWIGTGATSTGTVTATATADTNGRTLNLYHVSGTTGIVRGAVTMPTTSGSSPVMNADGNQIVFGNVWTRNSDGGMSGLTPSTGWVTEAVQTPLAGRYIGSAYRIPTSKAAHSFTASTAAGVSTFVQEVVLGTAADTYVLDWSDTSVGSTIDYTNANGRVALDSSIPAAPATNSLTWVPSLTANDNIYFELPITLSEAGAVYFHRRTSSENNFDFLRFYVDGVQQATWSGETPWAQSTFPLTAGAHTLRWAFTHDGGGVAGSNTAWLALLTVTGVATVPPRAISTKTTKLYDFEDGNVPSILSTSSWTNSTSGPISGTRSMRTPAVTAGSGVYDLTIDTASLTENGVIGFDFKRDSEAADLAMFRLGSTEIWRTLGPGETTNIRRIFAGGSPSLTIRYQKDASIDSGADAVWIDNLSVPYMVSAGPSPISSQFSGSGVLTTAWSNYVNLSSAFSGSGTLATALSNYKRIGSGFSGAGALSTVLTGYKRINSAFSGSGALSTVLAGQVHIAASFSGSGILSTTVSEPVGDTGGTDPIPPALPPLPVPLYLGQLASVSINTAAVPLNPAEGSGSAPSVNATYKKGSDPEFMLGETNTITNGAIGTYEGEVVKLGLSKSSAIASISMTTPLTLLNTEMHLFPFIDGVPGTWTAARAIDYWTQQCGLFYDKVPGQCIAYASGFGHTDSFGASTTARFYEKRTGGSTTTQVLNGRSVKTFGSAVTGKTALHEVKDGSVGVSVPEDHKLVFSIGMGLNGSGRTGSASWTFLDYADRQYTVSLQATSSGAVAAKLDGSTIATASVPAGETYRLTLSLEKLTSTTLAAKLTVHTDDLAGAGSLLHNGTVYTVASPMSSVLKLTSFNHTSSDGSGSQMTRWGTYLTVADTHPMELPAVQKALFETGKDFGFVAGFEGNVWNLLNEFCSIARLDVQYLGAQLRVPRRSTALAMPGGNFGSFIVDRERREKYKQVAVVNKQSKAVSTDDAVLWRADSVYQVAAREVFETTVQTGHSILSLVQPVAVNGIMPFPYKEGAGQYVVTGADGYIVAPGWWNDNGGKVEVSLTGKEGEIAIKITAPGEDTVRAPYRISEGAADRPALYISGSGILNDPVEVHIATGAKNAREGFDNVFESPFIAGTRETYDAAMAMASLYSASVAEVSFELPNDFEKPTGFGQFPPGTIFTDNDRNYRISDTSQSLSKVSGNAVEHTTIGAYVASYPPGATIADEKARHAGRTIRQFNIKPLRGTSETA